MKVRDILPYCDRELNIDLASNNFGKSWEHTWRNKEFKDLLDVVPEEYLDRKIITINGWDDGLTIIIED